MSAQPLTYEEMLSELLGLICTQVVVAMDLRFDRQRRPLASFYGELKRGKEADLTFHGERIGFPEGEAILFYVGDAAYFIMRKDDFKRGRRDDDVLAFEAGRARIVVGR